MPEISTLLTHNLNIASETLVGLNLLPTIPWDQTMAQTWEAGEVAAQNALENFLPDAAGRYKTDRDFPAIAGTSTLSPYLQLGIISPRQIWQRAEAMKAEQQQVSYTLNTDVFLKEVGWREFAYHLLYHYPQTPEKPLRPDFERFPWETDPAGLKAWQRGQTGYPIVDAGMRQLWATGWMHNRVRMIVASFLVKDLMIDWREGAQWFWDTLIDADLAANTLGWQWAGGCGADAAPYFRIFNPITQGERLIQTVIMFVAGFPNYKTCLINGYISHGKPPPDPATKLALSWAKPIMNHWSIIKLRGTRP